METNCKRWNIAAVHFNEVFTVVHFIGLEITMVTAGDQEGME